MTDLCGVGEVSREQLLDAFEQAVERLADLTGQTCQAGFAREICVDCTAVELRDRLVRVCFDIITAEDIKACGGVPTTAIVDGKSCVIDKSGVVGVNNDALERAIARVLAASEVM